MGKKKLTTEEFIEKAKKIHGDKYDYSDSIYVGKNIKLIIRCNKCGKKFLQTPDNHANGKQGCPFCAGNIKLTTEEFINKAKNIHGDNYDYSEVNYEGNDKKVKLKCNKCGQVFYQTPHHHLAGEGCPNCNKSRGEERIKLFLENNNIKFIREKKYYNCKDKFLLPFDFYLPEYNLLIEYQGDQHFRSYGKFGGKEKLIKQQLHDNIKREFCSKEENPNLLEITYKEYNLINKILTEKLNL